MAVVIYSHAEIVELPSTSSGGSIRNSQGELSTRSSNYSSGDISGSYKLHVMVLSLSIASETLYRR